MAKYKPIPCVWLKIPTERGKWVYGLARYEDGSIKISECLWEGFGCVGNYCSNALEEDETTEPCKLGKGERQMIIADLYMACCYEMKIKPNLSKANQYVKAKKVKHGN